MAASTYILAVVTVACFASVLGAKSVHYCNFCAGIEETCRNGNKSNLPSMDCSTTDMPPIGLDQFNLNQQQVDIVQSLTSNISEYAQKKAKSVKWVCLKYSIDHDDWKKTFVVKTCAPETILDQDICDWGDNLISLANMDTDTCSTCDKDFCNGASGFTHSFMIFSFLVPLVYKFFA